MKKFVSISFAIVSTLAFLLIAASPVGAAAGFVVSTAQATRSGTTVVYLEYSSTPYFAVTTTFSNGIGYPTTCGPSGSGFLKCVISSQLAQYHANQTAYIIMNSSEDNKAFFTVPEFEPKKDNCREQTPTAPTRAKCCQNPGFNAPCPD